MANLKNEWMEMLLREKISTVLGWIFGLSAIICLTLDIQEALDTLRVDSVVFPFMKIGYILLGGMYVCRSVALWRKNKGRAIIYMIGSVLLLMLPVISIYLSVMSG